MILSPQELRVAALTAQGLADKEIAHQMNLTHHTVKNYELHIRRKLGLQNKVQIAVWFITQVQGVRIPTIEPPNGVI